MDPLDHLVWPDDGAIIPDLAQGIISGMGTLTSPTAIVRMIMDKVFDFDPLAEVTKWIAGDWNNVAQMSRAYGHLADYVDECAASLGSEVRVAMEEWNGASAAAAESYALERLSPALTDLATGIGAIIGGAALGATILKIIGTVKMLNTYFGMAQMLIDSTSGLIPGYLGALKGFEAVPIPQLEPA